MKEDPVVLENNNLHMIQLHQGKSITPREVIPFTSLHSPLQPSPGPFSGFQSVLSQPHWRLAEKSEKAPVLGVRVVTTSCTPFTERC
jgi:hypothetical protein